jgi:hypothetical protein
MLVLDGLVSVRYQPAMAIRNRDDSYVVLEPKPFVACSRCEFCQEIRHDASV